MKRYCMINTAIENGFHYRSFIRDHINVIILDVLRQILYNLKVIGFFNSSV